MSRPLAELDPRVLDLLRLGAYQLLDLRVPSHAAVDTTVDLTRAIVGTGASGLVNAVLRKVAAGGDRAQWLAALGGDPASSGWPWRPTTRAGSWTPGATPWAASDDASWRRRCWPTTPRPRCTWSPAGSDRDALVEESGGEPGPWSPFAVRLHGGDPGRLPSVRSGAAAVQDEGSQLAALLLARAPLDGPGRRLAGHVRRPGRQGGPAGRRAARRRAARPPPTGPRTGPSWSRRRSPARPTSRCSPPTAPQPPWAPGSFDRVLLDAPCTGLGALRRRPEVRWRRTPDDVPPLVELQTALLDSALRRCASGASSPT